MPVFRVERTKNFTVMSNHHLRDKTISLKAKGLLSQMLSLPNDWDYTLRGLAAINKESIDAVRTAVHELEAAGYVVRSRIRDERGQLRGCDYFVYEYPHIEDSDVENCDDFSVSPVLETPVSDSTAQENPTQLNKEIPNKEKQNTDLILSDTDAVREQVQGNLELDLLCRNMPEAAPVLKEISELIVEAVQNQNSTQRFGINIFPADLVRSRLMQLTSEHIRYVLESLQTHSTCIRNPKKYLLAMLFNAPITMSSKTMVNKGNIIPRDAIIDELWQSEQFIDENTLNVNIVRLRKALTEIGLPDYLETKRGLGYCV